MSHETRQSVHQPEISQDEERHVAPRRLGRKKTLAAAVAGLALAGGIGAFGFNGGEEAPKPKPSTSAPANPGEHTPTPAASETDEAEPTPEVLTVEEAQAELNSQFEKTAEEFDSLTINPEGHVPSEIATEFINTQLTAWTMAGADKATEAAASQVAVASVSSGNSIGYDEMAKEYAEKFADYETSENGKFHGMSERMKTMLEQVHAENLLASWVSITDEEPVTYKAEIEVVGIYGSGMENWLSIERVSNKDDVEAGQYITDDAFFINNEPLPTKYLYVDMSVYDGSGDLETFENSLPSADSTIKVDTATAVSVGGPRYYTDPTIVSAHEREQFEARQ